MKRLLLIAGLCLAACNGGPAPSGAAPSGTAATAAGTASAPTAAPTAGPTSTPTPTPEPAAALVNDQAISLSAYQAEVARYESAAKALGRDLSAEPDYRAKVLDALIDQALMVQAAGAGGLTVSDADVQAAYDAAAQARGGQAGLDTWLQANGYTAESFRAGLRAGLLANAAQTKVADAVPAEAEQIHAREILVASRDDADKIAAQLAAGADFATLAVNNSLDPSRINGGDLGWFPAGGLTQPEVAQAAFALKVNEISQPVQSPLGFHVIQVLERGNHALSAPALAAMRAQAVAAWLTDLRGKARIQKLAP